MIRQKCERYFGPIRFLAPHFNIFARGCVVVFAFSAGGGGVGAEKRCEGGGASRRVERNATLKPPDGIDIRMVKAISEDWRCLARSSPWPSAIRPSPADTASGGMPTTSAEPFGAKPPSARLRRPLANARDGPVGRTGPFVECMLSRRANLRGRQGRPDSCRLVWVFACSLALVSDHFDSTGILEQTFDDEAAGARAGLPKPLSRAFFRRDATGALRPGTSRIRSPRRRGGRISLSSPHVSAIEGRTGRWSSV